MDSRDTGLLTQQPGLPSLQSSETVWPLQKNLTCPGPTLSEHCLGGKAHTPFTTAKEHSKGFCGLKHSRGFRSVLHFLTAYLDLEDLTVSITQEPSWRRLCYLAGVYRAVFSQALPSLVSRPLLKHDAHKPFPHHSPWSQSSHPAAHGLLLTVPHRPHLEGVSLGTSLRKPCIWGHRTQAPETRSKFPL